MRRIALPATLFVVLAVGTTVPQRDATAQTAKELAGVWTLASLTVDEQGKTVEPFGSHPKGMMTLNGDGRYTQVIVRPGLPKFKSGNRTAGTPEEDKAVVQGSIAHFGSYTVDEAGKVLILRIEASTFPNWDGAEQRRPFTISGDELTYTVPTASTGTGSAHVVWRRAK